MLLGAWENLELSLQIELDQNVFDSNFLSRVLSLFNSCFCTFWNEDVAKVGIAPLEIKLVKIDVFIHFRKDLVKQRVYFLIDLVCVAMSYYVHRKFLYLILLQNAQHAFYFFTWEKRWVLSKEVFTSKNISKYWYSKKNKN